MKTILVLSPHPNFATEIRNCLSDTDFRIVHRLSVDEAEPLLVHGLVSACILDTDLLGVESVWIIERLRRRDAKTPIIAYTESVQSDWEEEAFLRGVSQVLTKPVRHRLLNSILERLASAMTPATRPMRATTPMETSLLRSNTAAAVGQPMISGQTLDVLRDFSSILTHSLDAEAMLKQFLQFLREILSVNRAAIFLNRPCATADSSVVANDPHRLQSAAAIGLSAGLLENFELSFDSGIGAQVSRFGRILRRDGEDARLDAEIQREFELLGAQVAVPIPDRDAIVGVAVFDGRFTGEPLVNAELELIFHLL